MKNKTKFDINIQQALIKISTKKLRIGIIIFSIFLILFGGFYYRYDDTISIGLILGGIVVIMTFGFFWDKLMIRQFRNNSLFKGDTYNYYEFDENGFNIFTMRDENSMGQSTLKYSDLIKVVENKNFLFLFISNAQAFIISKTDMTEGKIEDLISLIKSKVNKFKTLK